MIIKIFNGNILFFQVTDAHNSGKSVIKNQKIVFLPTMKHNCRILLSLLAALSLRMCAAASTPALTLAFGGDVMMGTNFPETPEGAYLPRNNGSELFKAVAPVLLNADFAAANLEGTFLDNGGKLKECKDSTLCYAFRTPTGYVSNLKAAGLGFMAIANNHINDFGDEGRRSTKLTLGNAGIGYAGLKDSPHYYITSRRGRSIGFTAFSPHANTLNIHDLHEMKRIINHLDSICDVVVVSFHGGGEGTKYQHVPKEPEECFGEKRGDVYRFARAAVDAGADIVYGHGPHVTRAMELYRNRLIMYSLGNFCTPYRVNLTGLNGHAPVVTVDINADGKFIRGKIHPFVQRRGTGPVPDMKGTVIRHIKRLTAEDFPDTPLLILPDGTLTNAQNSSVPQ